MTRQPVEEVLEAQDFYASLGLEVHYFPALWHTFNVGHLLIMDLNRICRRHNLSLADFNLLGALRIERPGHLRPTDLAAVLEVSHAALSSRIARLQRSGMVIRCPTPEDRRASSLQLTNQGARLVEAIHAALQTECQFVRQLNRLPETDRAQLARIMGRLHTELGREFARPSG